MTLLIVWWYIGVTQIFARSSNPRHQTPFLGGSILFMIFYAVERGWL